jgi:hypothetical protein
MWIFTEDGFISAVDNGMEPGKLAVRARDKKSLSLLSEITGERIVSFRGTDYPYRVHVTREQLASFLVANVDTMDYSNFKNRVYDTRGSKFARACGKVWEAMLDVTDDEAIDSKF